MKDQIKRIIADFHQMPLPDFRRRSLEVPLDLGKIITIVGPRRVGKTFYLFQLMSDLMRRGVDRQAILYINFEDERLDLEGKNDLIFDAYRELYPERDLSRVYLFFDEIQELPGWEKFVRRVLDGISRHIFLTGSNSRLLSQEIATALRGRGLSFEILPLSSVLKSDRAIQVNIQIMRAFTRIPSMKPRELIRLIESMGCFFYRQGKGDHTLYARHAGHGKRAVSNR